MAKLVIEFDEDAGRGNVRAWGYDHGDLVVMTMMSANFLADRLDAPLSAVLMDLARGADLFLGSVEERQTVDRGAVAAALRRMREREADGHGA